MFKPLFGFGFGFGNKTFCAKVQINPIFILPVTAMNTNLRIDVISRTHPVTVRSQQVLSINLVPIDVISNMT